MQKVYPKRKPASDCSIRVLITLLRLNGFFDPWPQLSMLSTGRHGKKARKRWIAQPRIDALSRMLETFALQLPPSPQGTPTNHYCLREFTNPSNVAIFCTPNVNDLRR